MISERCDRRLCWRRATMTEEVDGDVVWARCHRHGHLENLERIAEEAYERLYGDRWRETLADLQARADREVAA